jgi:hypothetical protein
MVEGFACQEEDVCPFGFHILEDVLLYYSYMVLDSVATYNITR